MYQSIVDRYGEWRVFVKGCELDKIGFPPTWGTTRKQADLISAELESESVSLLRMFS